MIHRLLFLAVFLFTVSAASAAARTHVVERGETLTVISAKYGIDISTLARANKLRDKDTLSRGQKLHIPDSTTVFVEHRVKRGDALVTIAKRYQCSVADLRAHNPLAARDRIVVGQILRIPVAPGVREKAPTPKTAEQAAAAAGHQLPAAVQAAINGVAVRTSRWRNIVIHHSATREGSGKGMDRYHREERHMENGLAYHFVIGNGNGMGDGEIHVGARWIKQLPGGHLAIEALNENSLGICLVGDFEKKAPTRRQLDSLEALVRALQKKTAPRPAIVTSHRRIHPQHTKCPGKHFPLDAFLQRLQRP